MSLLDLLFSGFHGVLAQMLMQTGDCLAAARFADRAASTPDAHNLISIIALAAKSLAGSFDAASASCRARCASELRVDRDQLRAVSAFTRPAVETYKRR
jgi:hypothetical protein